MVTKSWMKIFESCLVAACSALILLTLIYAVPDCQPIHGYEPPSNVTIDSAAHGKLPTIPAIHQKNPIT